MKLYKKINEVTNELKQQNVLQVFKNWCNDKLYVLNVFWKGMKATI